MYRKSMHPSYKELAADMAKAMELTALTIIPDSSAISTKENPNCARTEPTSTLYVYAHLLC